jgi:hypothetical protein
MQKTTASPAYIVRTFLNKHLDLARLNEIDREMFVRAISEI